MRLTSLLGASAMFAVGAGCGGEAQDPPGTAETPPADASGVQQAAAESRDACELLTVAEISALAPEASVTATPDASPEWTSCAYSDGDSPMPLIEIMVYWENGKEFWETAQASYGLASELVHEPGVELDDVVQPGAVAGLGDMAVFNNLIPSYVLTGDILISVWTPALPDPELHFRSLMEKVLSRL